jgi:hypothetical protein
MFFSLDDNELSPVSRAFGSKCSSLLSIESLEYYLLDANLGFLI